MGVLLRFLYGAMAVMAVPRRSLRCRGDPTADWPNPRGTAEVLNMFKVPAVPPRRSAVLTVFRGATAINDGTTAEPRRSCRTSTAVAPRLRCDGTSTAEARRNMLKVAAVLPRRSAVLTVFRGATTINDGTTAEPRRSWRCHCGLCRTSTVVAPRLRCDGGITSTCCLRFEGELTNGETFFFGKQSKHENLTMLSVSTLNSNMVRKFGRKGVQCSVRQIKKSFLVITASERRTLNAMITCPIVIECRLRNMKCNETLKATPK